MIKLYKFLLALISVVVIAAAWGVSATVSSRLDNDQERLCADAEEYLKRKIYDKGTALLQDALQIKTDRNADIWRRLADIYRESGDLRGYRETLQTMIDGKITQRGAELADLYIEAYEYDKITKYYGADVLALLREGIGKTGSAELKEIYNIHRFEVIPGKNIFDEAGIIISGAGLVRKNGLWGYVGGKGAVAVTPTFELATNFYNNHAAVQKDGELYIIDRSGKRRALADDFTAEEIARFNGSVFSVMLPETDKYIMAVWSNSPDNPVIAKRETGFEYYGISSDGITAIKNDGKWIQYDSSNRKEKISTERDFEDIALDEFGRCAINGAVFVKTSGNYQMIDYAGNNIAGPFDDAKPFFEKGGWAAVEKDGKWGFINSAGNMVIDYIFEDAGSSSSIRSSVSAEILAPVKKDGFWGYIKTDGEFAIEPKYECAKQFVNGCAPVKEAAGWYYILLPEYE